MTDGTLETIDGRPVLRFDRTLASEVTEVDGPHPWPGPSAASGTASSWPLRKAAVGWSLPTSSTTARSQRRPQPAGSPICRGPEPFGVDPTPGRRFLAAQRAGQQ